MKTRQLGKGLEVSAIGFGCMGLNYRHNRRTNPCMGTSPSIILMARPMKGPEIMPGPWPPPCWRRLGLEFDANTTWDEREKLFKMSGKIVRTLNFTQSAEGDKKGLWTTVVAAAVLLP
jgi:hypothetical protein